MLPRCFLLLADNPLTLAQLRAEIEDLGEETRCQTALTAEEALFRLSQESVDAVLLLPCPAADCLTQSLLRHPPLAPPFLLGGLDGRLPEIPQLPAWFSVLRLPALAAAFLLSKPMAAYQMGESYARSVGVPVRAFSTALVLLSSLLSACVTAFAGPISFVGIAVPHLVKNLLGSAKPLYVLPGCCLGGAAFCLLCDLIARSLFAPTELSISSVTAVFGAPVVIWLLVRRQTQEGRE